MQLLRSLFSASCVANACHGDDVGPFYRPVHTERKRKKLKVQGLFVPFACVGSGDPVRVLRLYTTNTLDTLWSIYCWDICTTCRYRIYVLPAQALRLWDFLRLIRTLLKYLAKCALTLYCVVTYIAACVDASRTVFWDRSKYFKHQRIFSLLHSLSLWFNSKCPKTIATEFREQIPRQGL